MTNTPPVNDARVTVLSGPTVLIEYAGLRFLTDPTFDGPGPYEMSGLPLEKTAPSPIAPDDLAPIDVVLLSHDEHADNLDNAGRAFLDRVPLTLTTAGGAGRLGGTSRGLSFWEEHALQTPTGTTITVTAVPARHGPEGSEPYTGEVVGFLLTAPGQPNLYVSGDNASMEAVDEIANRAAPIDTAVIFVGGVHNEAFFDGAFLTFDNAQAAAAAQKLGARRVVPAHFEGWSHFSGSREDLVAVFVEHGLGDRLEFPELPEGAKA